MSDKTFADFGIHPEIAAALEEAGITTPFPIQAMTLPVALDRQDIIGQAKTGTGKTLGFGVPMVHHVVSPQDPGFDALDQPGAPQALAVAPTRELALQVASDLERAAAQRGIRVLTVYGGRAYEPQIEALERGVEIVVGTPGRLIDLCERGHLTLAHARTVVLDEAFDRADPVFTRTAMDVFASFGFHMVLATPLKLIKTLSPYVDGTIVVHYTEDPVARSTFELIDTHAPA